GSCCISGIALHRRFFAVTYVQFVAYRAYALNAFRYFNGLFSLSLAFNETAQSDNLIVGFNRKIGALNGFMIHQCGFHI
ncbi:hypothetical protein, partial [Pseudomonas aeruginosa]|uniref:hypothetical protein n=1 Tax=Pseudomonas aeruginosa TaxID=287 RepID=UPI0026ED55FE